MRTMTNLSEETLAGLQELIGINVDSAKGFAAAAEAVDNPGAEKIFRKLSQQRRQFAGELETYANWNGEKCEDEASVRGQLHRLWLKARAALTDGDSVTVLEDVERGEAAILARYREVILDTTGSPVNGVLHRQITEVKQAHDDLRFLREVMQEIDKA